MTRAYTSTRLGITLLVALLCTWCATPLRGQTTEQYTPVPNFPGFALNGPVFAMQEVGDLIYVGGNFTQATTRFTQNGLLMTDINRGGVLNGFPGIVGQIAEILPDGRGGWYLFGNMRITGEATNAAYTALRVTHTLAIDPAFKVVDQTGGYNYVITVLEHGSDIYYAQSQNVNNNVSIYRISKNTGSPVLLVESIQNRRYFGSHSSQFYNQGISSLSLVVFGKYLICVGNFNFVNDARRESVMAYDLTVNSISSDFSFDFDDDNNTSVNDMFVVDGKIWLGGWISYQNNNSAIAYLDLDGQLTFPASPLSGYVYDLERYGNSVFAVGTFYNNGNASQYDGLRVFDAITEQPIAWGSSVTHSRSYVYVTRAKAIGNTVYLTGDFDRYGATARSGFIALNAWDGTPVSAPIFPQPSGGIQRIGISGSRVLLCGYFSGTNPIERPYLMAFSKTTGLPVNWNSRANGPVYDIAYDGSNLVVGGDFTSIAGAARSRVAVLNASNRGLRSTVINANARVNQVASNGTLIALAGDFTEVNGAPREGIAMANRSNGTLLAWTPIFSGFANQGQYSYPEYERFTGLAFGANDLYVTGSFSSLNGLSKQIFAAFDLSTLNLSSGAPNIIGGRSYGGDVLVNEGQVYVFGDFGGYDNGSDFVYHPILLSFDDATKEVQPNKIYPQSSLFFLYGSNMRISAATDRLFLSSPARYFRVSNSLGGESVYANGVLTLNKSDWAPIANNFSFSDWPVLEAYPTYRYRYAGVAALIPSSNGRLYIGGANGLNPNPVYSSGAIGAYELAAPTPQAPTTELSTLASLPNSDAAPDSVAAPSISLSPNPTPGPATLTLTLPQAASVGVEVITASGQSVPLFREQPFPQGTHTIPITVQPGAAQVVIRVNGRPYVERILRF